MQISELPKPLYAEFAMSMESEDSDAWQNLGSERLSSFVFILL